MRCIFVILALLFANTALASVDYGFNGGKAAYMLGREFDLKGISDGAAYDSSRETGTFAVSESLQLGNDRDTEQGTLIKFSGTKAAEDSRDWKGIKRDTLYFMGYQFAVIGALYVAPESVSSWSNEQKKAYSLSRWWDNITSPRMDPDRWWLNYITHPYWGATYYVRARERHFDEFDSFKYSLLLSSIFEFGIEGLFEKLSIQDIIVTPVVGSLVGTYFDKARKTIKGRGRSLWYDDIVIFATDPLGEVNKAMDKLLGINASVEIKSIQPLYNLNEPLHFEPAAQQGKPRPRQTAMTYPGIELKVNW
ncbi:MAG: DUF3943 domain-containing protein [Nitrospirae bacterium]|nr:DUF3943 domain-containing protein [Nitrospirota bacterium]